jgi:uncharacterized protein YjbJ (UPF0337 family)
MINKEIYESRWQEIHGQIKGWWGQITDDDLKQAGSSAEKIVSLLQQRYDYTRQGAEEEFNRRINNVKQKVTLLQNPPNTRLAKGMREKVDVRRRF